MQADQVAVVTGGGRGIGRAIALRLARDGVNLSLWARSAAEIEAVASEARDLGVEAVAVPTDVSNWEAVRKAAEMTLKAFGRVDILVNNAGVGGPRATVADADPETWAHTLLVDLNGPFYCMRALLPSMIERGSGRIVNVSGGGAGEPYPGNSAYATAKTGLVRLSETVAHEVRSKNIQVNAMTPGLVVTRLTEESLREMQRTDPERAAQFRQAMETQAFPSEEGAELVAFLVSPAARDVTGRWFTVYDDWKELVRDPGRLMEDDLYVLRRHPR